MDKDKIVARKNLAISREWQQIKGYLFEEIKEKSRSQIDGTSIKAMLYTISMVDDWEQEFLKQKKKEEKGV